MDRCSTGVSRRLPGSDIDTTYTGRRTPSERSRRPPKPLALVAERPFLPPLYACVCKTRTNKWTRTKRTLPSPIEGCRYRQMVVLGQPGRGRGPLQWAGSGQPWHAPPSSGRGRGQPNPSWAGPNVDRTSSVPVGYIDDGYFSVPHVSGAASETWRTRHERDGERDHWKFKAAPFTFETRNYRRRTYRRMQKRMAHNIIHKRTFQHIYLEQQKNGSEVLQDVRHPVSRLWLPRTPRSTGGCSVHRPHIRLRLDCMRRSLAQ